MLVIKINVIGLNASVKRQIFSLGKTKSSFKLLIRDTHKYKGTKLSLLTYLVVSWKTPLERISFILPDLVLN